MISCLSDLLIYPLELIIEFIFSLAYEVFQNPGLSIIAVSLAVNLLTLPLYNQADRIQSAERQKQKSMEKWVTHIKKAFKGDERFFILNTYYRQQNYKPFYALKSAVSLLLQIPFFMAAYNFLSGLGILSGTSFLFIKDLGQQDGLLKIGSLSLNLLPILMTVFNILSGMVYTKGFKISEKIQLYAMAAVFLFVLYDKPAGLAFYWMLNNLFSLVKNLIVKGVELLKARAERKKLAEKEVSAPKELIEQVSVQSTEQVSLECTEQISSVNSEQISGVNSEEISKKPVEKNDSKGVFSSLLPKHDTKMFTIAALLMAATVGLLAASQIIASSPSDFSKMYSIGELLLHNGLIAAGLFIIWCPIFYWLCGKNGKSIFMIFAATASLYGLIAFFLYGRDLGTMSVFLTFDETPKFSALQICSSIGLFLVILFVSWLLIKLKPAILKAVLTIALIGVLGLSVVHIVQATTEIKKQESTVVAGKESDNKKEQTIDDFAGIIKLSKTEKNVVVLMLDRAITGYVPYILQENESVRNAFQGFTYYPNTITYGSHTNFAAPALFGGYEYNVENFNARSQDKLSTKYKEAMMVMPKMFTEIGYSVNAIDLPYAGYNPTPKMEIFSKEENMDGYLVYPVFETDDKESVSFEKEKRNLFYYSMFRVVIEGFKDMLYANGTYRAIELSVDDEFVLHYQVLENLEKLTSVTEGKGTLTLMDSESAHYPTYLSADYTYDGPISYGVNEVTDGDGNVLKLTTEKHRQYFTVNMATFMALGDWFDYLKKEGVWDNTRIILVSDHGSKYLHQWTNQKSADKGAEVEAYASLLLVKDFGATEFTTDNTFMTVADVPTLATENLIDHPTNPFTGKEINSNEKNEKPQVLTTSGNYKLYDNDGYTYKTEDGHWYSVSGDIYQPENWIYLGNDAEYKESLKQKEK